MPTEVPRPVIAKLNREVVRILGLADVKKQLLGMGAEPVPTTPEAFDAQVKDCENEYAALKGTLAAGPDRLLAAYRLNDALGQLAYRVYYYPSLKFDEDQRDNAVRLVVQRLLHEQLRGFLDFFHRLGGDGREGAVLALGADEGQRKKGRSQ